MARSGSPKFFAAALGVSLFVTPGPALAAKPGKPPAPSNHGLVNYIYENKRLLPCDMSKNAFFIDPFCDVIPCNGMEKKAIMGNLHNQSWDELWNSAQAEEVRKCTKNCDRNCWMIGSASPAMHKYIWVPVWWVLKYKFFKAGKYRLDHKFIMDSRG
jgi:hypothetical protein